MNGGISPLGSIKCIKKTGHHCITDKISFLESPMVLLINLYCGPYFFLVYYNTFRTPNPKKSQYILVYKKDKFEIFSLSHRSESQIYLLVVKLTVIFITWTLCRPPCSLTPRPLHIKSEPRSWTKYKDSFRELERTRVKDLDFLFA